MLARLLKALADLQTDAEISVIVADNDAEQREGFRLCNRLAAAYRWPLKAVIAPERGIAQVRNRLVAEALTHPRADFIAMIDDDEWPDPFWITEFLAVQKQTGADALQGSILFDDAAMPDIRRATGRIAMLQGAGNLLLSARRLAGMTAPWFDPAFALSGGEDRDFFLRLEREGASFAWADAARAYGDVALLKYHPGLTTRLMEAAKIVAALLLSLPLAVILSASPNRRLAPLTKIFRAAGKLTAMAGWRYNEYAVVHGE
jgi:glycosyltransferase involved in cell wall biosynthesis